jgi:hypothetical protein
MSGAPPARRVVRPFRSAASTLGSSVVTELRLPVAYFPIRLSAKWSGDAWTPSSVLFYGAENVQGHGSRAVSFEFNGGEPFDAADPVQSALLRACAPDARSRSRITALAYRRPHRNTNGSVFGYIALDVINVAPRAPSDGGVAIIDTVSRQVASYLAPAPPVGLAHRSPAAASATRPRSDHWAYCALLPLAPTNTVPKWVGVALAVHKQLASHADLYTGEQQVRDAKLEEQARVAAAAGPQQRTEWLYVATD